MVCVCVQSRFSPEKDCVGIRNNENAVYGGCRVQNVVTAVMLSCYRSFGKKTDVSIMPSKLTASQRHRALKCETTFLQAHACCMMIIPRNCSQVGDFSWSGRIGFERSASEKGRRIDRLLALESMAAVKPGRMTRSKAVNAVLHYQRVGTNTRLAIRISNEQSLSNNDNERRNRARSTNLTFLAREGVRGFPRTTYISEKTCHLTNLHTELHPFDSGLL